MIYDWTNEFDSTMVEWLQYEDPSHHHLNHLLIICCRKEIEEMRNTASFRHEWSNVNFTYKRIKNAGDALILYDNIWEKNEYSNIIFSDCNARRCRFCKNGLYLKKHLKRKSLIQKEGAHYFHIRNVFSSGIKLLYSKFIK